jgi:hypothetical protein
MKSDARKVALPIFEIRVGRSIDVPDRWWLGLSPAWATISPLRRRTPGLRHFRQQRRGQRFADAIDAEQQVVPAAQLSILLDRLANGAVDGFELVGEMLDRRGANRVAVLSPRPLPRRFFHSVRFLTIPARTVCSSHSRRIAADGGVHGAGLNNAAYSRIRAASALSSYFDRAWCGRSRGSGPG